MRIFVPKETWPGETRAALVPATVEKLGRLGMEVEIESGLGASFQVSEEEYRRAGAGVCVDREAALSRADLILRVRKPPQQEIRWMKRGALHISLLDPFREAELVSELAAAGVNAIALELLPRTTLAQKMDVLSSQANLAGYVAVLLAATATDRLFPLMMTPAGTIRPAKVLIVGVGVAGLQAIATAKRLGAAVAAFDTRPVVEEQVRSLGARFVKIDLGETGQTEQGYARELSPEQLARQREALAAECATAEVVITAAQVFGRPAPVIITRGVIERMNPGALVLDMAIETGGNVEGSRLDEEVVLDGVRILAPANLPGRVPRTASELYSNNVGNFIEHFWTRESHSFRLDSEDPLLRPCLVTRVPPVPAPAPAAVPQPTTAFPQ